jgi:hypothetical protein
VLAAVGGLVSAHPATSPRLPVPPRGNTAHRRRRTCSDAVTPATITTALSSRSRPSQTGMRLSGRLRGSTARSSRLSDGVTDRSAVLQSVAEVDHLVAVVLIAPVGGTRRRREPVPLLPQPQRARAYVKHRGGFVDRERGSTLLLRMYRQPRSIPLALSRIADSCRMGPARRRTSGSRTRANSLPPRPEPDTRVDPTDKQRAPRCPCRAEAEVRVCMI